MRHPWVQEMLVFFSKTRGVLARDFDTIVSLLDSPYQHMDVARELAEFLWGRPQDQAVCLREVNFGDWQSISVVDQSKSGKLPWRDKDLHPYSPGSAT